MEFISVEIKMLFNFHVVKVIIQFFIILPFFSIFSFESFQDVAIHIQHSVISKEVSHLQQALFNRKPVQGLTDGDVVILDALAIPFHEITLLDFNALVPSLLQLAFTSAHHLSAIVDPLRVLKVRGYLEEDLPSACGDVQVPSSVLEFLERIGEKVEGVSGSVLIVFDALSLIRIQVFLHIKL